MDLMASLEASTVTSGSGTGSILLLTFVGRCRYVPCARLQLGEAAWRNVWSRLSVSLVACDEKRNSRVVEIENCVKKANCNGSVSCQPHRRKHSEESTIVSKLVRVDAIGGP